MLNVNMSEKVGNARVPKPETFQKGGVLDVVKEWAFAGQRDRSAAILHIPEDGSARLALPRRPYLDKASLSL